MDSLGSQLKAAREKRQWSRGRLSHATGQVGGRPYVAEPTVEAIEVGKTKRPDDATILRLGAALEVEDEAFPAYALARARRLLDEWQVGDEALENLNLLVGALPGAPSGRARQDGAAQRLADLGRRLQATPPQESPPEEGATGGSA